MGQIKKGRGGVGSGLAVHRLPSVCEVLGSIPSTLEEANQPCFSVIGPGPDLARKVL